MLLPPILTKNTFIITSFFVPLTTSNTTNITTANSPITTSVNWVMNCARNTIFPSSFRVRSVAENTKNGSPSRMVLHGKRRSERTSISASSRLPLTKNFCFWWEPKGMKSKGKLLKKELSNTSHSALWIKSVLCVAVRSLWERNTQRNVSGNTLKENGNERQLSPKKTTLTADLLTPLTRNFRTVRDCKGGLPSRI